MPVRRSPSLHGNVSDHSSTALLLIDVINTFEFPGAERLLAQARSVAPEIAALKRRTTARGISTVYANDNFGRWRSDRNDLVSACERKPGGEIVRLLAPRKEDYFVLKPKNSAFYTTTLELLLDHIGVRRLVLAGWQGVNCILFTANDAYLRDYRLHVPSDCVASIEPRENLRALEQMKGVLKADVRPWRKMPLLRR